MRGLRKGIGRERGRTSCHRPTTSLCPINLSHVSVLTFCPTPNSLFPSSTLKTSSHLAAKPILCVYKCQSTNANSPFGKRFVLASIYPASFAPRDSVVCVKPCVGMCGPAAERMSDSVALKGPGGGGWSREWYVLILEALRTRVWGFMRRVKRGRRVEVFDAIVAG